MSDTRTREDLPALDGDEARALLPHREHDCDCGGLVELVRALSASNQAADRELCRALAELTAARAEISGLRAECAELRAVVAGLQARSSKQGHVPPQIRGYRPRHE